MLSKCFLSLFSSSSCSSCLSLLFLLFLLGVTAAARRRGGRGGRSRWWRGASSVSSQWCHKSSRRWLADRRHGGVAVDLWCHLHGHAFLLQTAVVGGVWSRCQPIRKLIPSIRPRSDLWTQTQERWRLNQLQVALGPVLETTEAHARGGNKQPETQISLLWQQWEQTKPESEHQIYSVRKSCSKSPQSLRGSKVFGFGSFRSGESFSFS